MRTSIATVCLSGTLEEKMQAAALAGFDGIEVFEQDLVVSPSSSFRFSLFDGGTTFATAIANAAPEFNDDIRAGAYIAAGLVLFLLTFVVNSIARAIVAKK